MADVTSYVALPFHRTTDGILIPGESEARPSAEAAIEVAERMARSAAGAVAFSRTGNPESGEAGDAVILRQWGEVPSLDYLKGGP